MTDELIQNIPVDNPEVIANAFDNALALVFNEAPPTPDAPIDSLKPYTPRVTHDMPIFVIKGPSLRQ